MKLEIDMGCMSQAQPPGAQPGPKKRSQSKRWRIWVGFMFRAGPPEAEEQTALTIIKLARRMPFMSRTRPPEVKRADSVTIRKFESVC
jgi:hypothetical protein